MLLLPILTACIEYGVTPGPSPEDTGGLRHWTEAGSGDEGGNGGGGNGGGGNGGGGNGGGGSDNDDGGSSDDPDEGNGGGSDETEEPGSSRDSARAPKRGEVVINELLIDPDGVSDADGEWVELWNVGSAWVDLEGARLADEGVDDIEIEGSDLVVEPGGFLVVCAEDSTWDNGGVDCQATFVYETWGGGFAMSNIEDEVVLYAGDGTKLDDVSWGEGFAAVGEAMGVDPDQASVNLNDDLSDWCEQWGWLNSGDMGNPGEENDWCW
ncbi:MAG: lamin tail domain-containing protein [Proteobacteria bacterium]|nr:lamin tail domain-containing protein [Pseudomonadota bacterium]MCP4921533.1 lamin tail domain-containing protein [Pseudomonadota bacterium]